MRLWIYLIMQRMVQSKAIRPNGGQLDILESLGLIHTQKVYEQRVKALATPGVYNRERKEEWDKIKRIIKKEADHKTVPLWDMPM